MLSRVITKARPFGNIRQTRLLSNVCRCPIQPIRLRIPCSTTSRLPNLHPSKLQSSVNSFHSSRPVRSPLIPLPALLLAILKTEKLVSLVSLSSKTSLTLLPHTFKRGGKYAPVARILALIPLAGIALLIIVGLDQAPNTSRLRLMYLSEEEENEIVENTIEYILVPQIGLVDSQDTEDVMWIKTIVDNLAAAAVDDIRDPVRRYDFTDKAKIPDTTYPILVPSQLPMNFSVDIPVDEGPIEYRPEIPHREFTVFVVRDATTVNASCVGNYFIVYDKLIELMEYDTDRLAVILSHEIAHSIQRHFVETSAFRSLLVMLGDVARGAFWMVTEPFGPYVNQKINDMIATFIELETDMTYNRKLEKEADLVGLKILAKAGYDPRVAIDVWNRMAEEEERREELAEALIEDEQLTESQFLPLSKKKPKDTTQKAYNNLESDITEYLGILASSWFGSTHPPTRERIEYIKENMDEAVDLWNQSIKINGEPTRYLFNNQIERLQPHEYQQNQQQIELNSQNFFSRVFNQLVLIVDNWSSPTASDTATISIVAAASTVNNKVIS